MRPVTIMLMGALLWLAAGAAAGTAALARQRVAVLAFGGDPSDAVRGRVARALSRGHEVVHGDLVLDACDALGIPMSRGRNLARCARRAEVVAVVGGALQDGVLTLAVYNGKTGQVVKQGSVTVGGRMSGGVLRQAVRLIEAGLARCPRAGGGRRPPRPTPQPEPVEPEGPGEDLTFDPEAITGGGSEPDPGGEDPLAADTSMGEDPLADTPSPSGGGGQDLTFDPQATGAAKDDGGKDQAGDDWWSKVEIFLGVGTMIRDFTLNDPANVYKLTAYGKKEQKNGKDVLLFGHPSYNSGAAFALRVGAKIRPAAFFTDNFASWLYARLQYQTTVGLQSRLAASGATAATRQDELLLDLGVDWNIQGTAESPHVGLGLGFGMSSFSIDWPTSITKVTDTNNRMPNTSYAFFLLKADAKWMFFKYFGAHLSFDYRAVGGAGDIEHDKYWYGDASVGGISLGLGLDGKYKLGKFLGLVASLEYTYTRYFYTFSDASARLLHNNTEAQVTPAPQGTGPDNEKMKRVAGGALDILHGIIFTVGWAY